MSDELENKTSAWQPLTFKGVARFARGSYNRVFLIELFVAFSFALAAVWFVGVGWAPVLEQAIERLGRGAVIEQGSLFWPGEKAERLAEGPFIEFIVTPGGDAAIGQTADLQVELTQHELKFRSLFGYLAIPYPADQRILLAPEEAAATWGAWKGPLFLIVFLGIVVGLLFLWPITAAFYTAPALLFGFYVSRPTTFPERFRLCSAALMPAALLLCAALALYALRQLSLVGFLVAWMMHLMLGWIYVAVGLLQLPTTSPLTGGNPFSSARTRPGGL